MTLRLNPRMTGTERGCGHVQGTARTLFDCAGDPTHTSCLRGGHRQGVAVDGWLTMRVQVLSAGVARAGGRRVTLFDSAS